MGLLSCGELLPAAMEYYYLWNRNWIAGGVDIIRTYTAVAGNIIENIKTNVRGMGRRSVVEWTDYIVDYYISSNIGKCVVVGSPPEVT